MIASAHLLRRGLPLLIAGLAGFVFASVAFLILPDTHESAAVNSAGPSPAENPVPVWSRLASTDRITFAANLRAIGCPEETIERIVLNSAPAGPTRDVDAEALPTRTNTPATGSGVAPTVATVSQPIGQEVSVAVSSPKSIPVAIDEDGETSSRAPALGLEAVRRAQARIARLSGVSAPVAFEPAIASENAAATMNQADPSAPIVAPMGNAAIPVAFQPIAGDAHLNASQQAGLASIQNQFVKNIGGGTPADPSAPAYQKQWRSAQQMSDQQYRALFGQQAFLKRQIATVVAQNSAGNSTSTP